MNDVQLKRKRKALLEEMRAKGYGYVAGTYTQPPVKYEKRYKELKCIEMINSILCYNCRGYQNAEDVMQYEETKSYINYLEDYVKVLGRDRVVKLIQEQIDSISGIEESVFVDGEGCTYHSIIWKENEGCGWNLQGISLEL